MINIYVDGKDSIARTALKPGTFPTLLSDIGNTVTARQ